MKHIGVKAELTHNDTEVNRALHNGLENAPSRFKPVLWFPRGTAVRHALGKTYFTLALKLPNGIAIRRMHGKMHCFLGNILPACLPALQSPSGIAIRHMQGEKTKQNKTGVV